MFLSFLYVIFAILGLSFLIFIHELGHYFMARHVGMRVETFSIGFGRPMVSWNWQGVRWQIGWLLFGGYVKIAGTELEKDKNPYEVKDGFFGKSPIDRIKVSMMGPLTNLVFALLAFSILWMLGGRDKHFSDFTSKIGWIDPESELFIKGVRPGDEIIAYGTEPYQGSKDNLYAPMTSQNELQIKGYKVNYATGQKIPYDYEIKTYQHPNSLEKGIKTSGILNSASYLIYNRFPNGSENPLPPGSPLEGSGLKYGDRIFWVDGEIIFSWQQLNHILSGQRVLLTIERDGKHFLARVPRIPVQELRPDPEFREELIDWQFETGLQGTKLQNLYAIPYNLTNNNVVENPLKFIDKEKQSEAFPTHSFSVLDVPLEPGDKILAINGRLVDTAHKLFELLQTYYVSIIVQRDPEILQKVKWTQADEQFNNEIHWDDLQKIVNSIGTPSPLTHKGDFYLLKPIAPKPRSEFSLSAEKQSQLTAELEEQKRAIDSIEDPEQRNQALSHFKQQEKRLLLGIPSIEDRTVGYNPDPVSLFENVFGEIWRTLSALVSGMLNPKWIAGPIGIVQMVHDTSMTNLKEALYWLGAISLNLGVLNLLPIPVLDGGTILMSLMELVTRKKLHPKTMEKMILPFAILLIAFFIFLTYNDISRLFTTLMR